MSPSGTVSSYLTISPLPGPKSGRYTFCCTGCILTEGPFPLGSTVSVGVRTFLCILLCSDHPATPWSKGTNTASMLRKICSDSGQRKLYITALLSVICPYFDYYLTRIFLLPVIGHTPRGRTRCAYTHHHVYPESPNTPVT